LTESGTPFAPDLIDYLLRHKPRDLRSLLALLHALDRYALERQRMLTVPLLRDFERQSAVKLHAS
jgi:DnaA family protein